MGKIRFGVVGTNFISDWFLAGAAQDKRFELMAVCSRRQDTADAFAKRHNIPLTFTSLERMAASPDIDAVYIATPNFLHASQSILCMEQGKHVLCEKPMASNAREAKAVIETAKKHGVVFMEAMKPTMSPNFKILADNIARLGTIRRYFASFCQYSSRYDRFKAGEMVNAFNPQYSTGALMDLGIYTIYPMVALFGIPDKVSASVTLLPSGVDGQGSVTFSYDGMEAVAVYSKISDSRLPSEIQGEKGTITIDRINAPRVLTLYPNAKNLGGGIHDTIEPETLSVGLTNDEYYYEVAEFIDLIESGRSESAINSHTNSLATITLLDEIRRQAGVVFPADKF